MLIIIVAISVREDGMLKRRLDSSKTLRTGDRPMTLRCCTRPSM